jgi:hypothetical protein
VRLKSEDPVMSAQYGTGVVQSRNRSGRCFVKFDCGAAFWIDESMLSRRPPGDGPFGYPDQEPQEVEAEAKAREAHAARKARPLFRGLVAYFPDALELLSECSVDADRTLTENELIASLADGHRHEMQSVALSLLHELQAYLVPGCVSIEGGLFARFGEALSAVAEVSRVGNEQHHPGGPLYWEKDKSADHEDCLLRHYVDHKRGRPADTDGSLHLAKSVWRSLASVQTSYEVEYPDVAERRQAQRDRQAKGER